MKKHFTLLMLLLFCCYLSQSQVRLSLQQFSQGYKAPVAIENCGDSRLFIVQESGQIIIADATGARIVKPFLDISSRVTYNGEQGLLGLAFDPGYKTNHLFYVYYIDVNGSTQVSRFTVSSSPNVAIASSERKILNIQQPFTNHKGGCIHFGKDGYLYISTGDGGSGGDPNNNAQNPQSLLGKILRIDVHHITSTTAYVIPPTNPFVDSSNYRPEIWALGLRNPWRWSFDTVGQNNMIIADVGQANYEEVDFQNVQSGGKNYGWRCYEGFHPYNTAGCKSQSSYTSPVYEYDHSTGDCAIIGGYIYRGTRYSFLQGKYLFTDYCSGKFRTLVINYPNATEQDIYTGDANSYTCFGEDNKHELYVANQVTNKIYHIAVVGTPQTEVIASAPAFTLAPNPSHGSFNVSYKSDKVQQVIVHIQNSLGQQFYISRLSLSAGSNNLNLNVRIPHGDYFVTITDTEGRTSNQRLRIE